MSNIDIESVLRGYVPMGSRSAQGWEACVHTECDHGTKGMRAAFKFDPLQVAFNCFNCGEKVVQTYNDNKLNPKFRKLLEGFNVDKKTIDSIALSLFSNKEPSANPLDAKSKAVSIIPQEIPLLSGFVSLESVKDTPIGELAYDYLIHDRLIDPKSHPFMICPKTRTESLKRWENRLIIPYFYKNEVIFYQGRDLIGDSEQKYLNAAHKLLDRSKIISNYDIMHENTDMPLYITEGWFDAHLLGGVAVFGNQIHSNQYAWLNRSYREKVFVPDRYGDGLEVAIDAIKHGFKVALPYGNNTESSIKDVTDLFALYGRLHTLMKIQTSITNDVNIVKMKMKLSTKNTK